MTILLDDEKCLKITKHSTIYKFETGIDNIKILLPQKYKDILLSELTCVVLVKKSNKGLFKYMKYKQELYKDRLCVELPITSTLTKEVGDISLWIMLIKRNEENPTLAKNVLQTNSVIFSITDNGSESSSSEEKFDEVWEHVNSDEIYDKINNLSDKVKNISDTKADKLTLDDNNNLVLKSGDSVLATIKLTDDVVWEEWK